jgi:hypothetical protein
MTDPRWSGARDDPRWSGARPERRWSDTGTDPRCSAAGADGPADAWADLGRGDAPTDPRWGSGMRDPRRGRPSGRRRRHGVLWLNLLAATLIGAGVIVAFVGHDTLRWVPPPVPPAWAAGHPSNPPHRLTAGRGHGAAPRLSPAAPVSIEIPAIKVRAKVIGLGLTRDGAIGVPPLSTPFVTAWYDQGPAPGQPGAAVILGHVDASGVGPAIFYDLGKVRPGDRIYVRLGNGRTAIFEAYSIALYRKTSFPTAHVFGYTSWPTLRLVTCGGEFDAHTGHYLGNTVVFASYVGQRPAV